MACGYRGRLNEVSGSVRRPSLAVLLTLGVMLGAAAPSQAIVTVGSDLSQQPNDTACAYGSFDVQGLSCVHAQLSLQPAHQAAGGIVAPIDGVVVHWRLRVGPAGSLTALSARPMILSGNLNSAFGASVQLPLSQPGIHAFPAHLPIRAGQRIGAEFTFSNMNEAEVGPPVIHQESGIGVVDNSYGAAEINAPESFSQVENAELLLNADIEPDADRDGFGDETEDLCPTNQAIQAPCPDREPPKATASFAARQNFLVTKEIVVKVGTDETGTAIGTAQVRIKGKKKPLPVFTDRVAVTAGQKRTLHLRVPGKTRKAVAAAFKAGKKATARVAVKVVDAAGNESAEQIVSIRPLAPKKAN